MPPAALLGLDPSARDRGLVGLLQPCLRATPGFIPLMLMTDWQREHSFYEWNQNLTTGPLSKTLNARSGDNSWLRPFSRWKINQLTNCTHRQVKRLQISELPSHRQEAVALKKTITALGKRVRYNRYSHASVLNNPIRLFQRLKNYRFTVSVLGSV